MESLFQAKEPSLKLLLPDQWGQVSSLITLSELYREMNFWNPILREWTKFSTQVLLYMVVNYHYTYSSGTQWVIYVAYVSAWEYKYHIVSMYSKQRILGTWFYHVGAYFIEF